MLALLQNSYFKLGIEKNWYASFLQTRNPKYYIICSMNLVGAVCGYVGPPRWSKQPQFSVFILNNYLLRKQKLLSWIPLTPFAKS